MVLRPKTLQELRKFLHDRDTDEVYNILSAIRGPDNHGFNEPPTKNESHLKNITKAIRSYIGFRRRNCPGDLVGSVTPNSLRESINFVDKEFDGEDTTHYVSHLKFALDSIGRENLTKFVIKHQS